MITVNINCEIRIVSASMVTINNVPLWKQFYVWKLYYLQLNDAVRQHEIGTNVDAKSIMCYFYTKIALGKEIIVSSKEIKITDSSNL